jgi:hypothetical protein
LKPSSQTFAGVADSGYEKGAISCIIHDFSQKCLDSLPGEALSACSGSTGCF